MEKIKYYLGKDYFGIREAGQDKVKRFNLFLLIITCVFLFIFVFFIIIYSCTNYHQLDELDDYVKNFQSSNLSQFDSINLGVKIMPSYNTERNILYMKHSEKVSLLYNTFSMKKQKFLTPKILWVLMNLIQLFSD